MVALRRGDVPISIPGQPVRILNRFGEISLSMIQEIFGGKIGHKVKFSIKFTAASTPSGS